MNATLWIAGPFRQEDIQRVCKGFEQMLHMNLSFEVVRDESLLGGFAAFIDGRVIDCSLRNRLDSIKKRLEQDASLADQQSRGVPLLHDFMREHLGEFDPSVSVAEYGVVRSCADEIVQIHGCSHARYGEILSFNGGQYALAVDLSEQGVGAVLLEKYNNVTPDEFVRGTGRVADICVGREVLGRVIDPIGRPLDGQPLEPTEWRACEQPAPAIMDRAPVDRPLMTGLLAIDAMIPIGRGQRELIVGDRQTGKTTIALDAMLNQKSGDVVCVYCAIGQKAATISRVVRTLRQEGVMDNCVVVASAADDGVALQYLTPYAGCSIAEYFMQKGRDVLIVYDDLSKHAAAYRSMSLLLRRPSGREAYPGDVFYLHSRLLERSARLSDEHGGGSITALPIIETMAGDISAYIPTNVISITDGQIYLETELFNAGVTPAVNVGLSVSRVGRSAQHKAMRDVSGSLRLELAQYRDTAVFAQFGADIDDATKKLLASGERLTELFKQKQDEVLSLSEQVAVLLAYRAGLFLPLDRREVSSAKRELVQYLREHCSGTMRVIDSTGTFSEETRTSLENAAREFFGEYHAEHR